MRKFVKPILIVVFFALIFSFLGSVIQTDYSAQDTSEINAGDTAFVAVAAVLVMLMTPALGFFYAGLVRKKNLVSMIVQSVAIFALISIVWALWGYSLAFGPDVGGITGDLSFFGLKGVGVAPDPSCNPYLAFAVMLKAGLDGIKNKILLSEPIEEDVYEFSDEKLKELNIGILPSSLKEALEEFSKSDLMKETFGEETFNKYIDAKLKEWDEFRIAVTDWESNRYFEVL